jgi:hypothetical protein
MTGIALGAAIKGKRPIMVHMRVDFALLAIEPIVNQAAQMALHVWWKNASSACHTHDNWTGLGAGTPTFSVTSGVVCPYPRIEGGHAFKASRCKGDAYFSSER